MKNVWKMWGRWERCEVQWLGLGGAQGFEPSGPLGYWALSREKALLSWELVPTPRDLYSLPGNSTNS